MAAANYPYLGMSQYRNPAGPPSNFTFTTPTQCTTLGTPRPCIETISPINLSAPGVGASWQHSIPTTMPWVDMSSAPQQMPVGSATVFTGLPFNILRGHAPAGNPNPARRSKRRALDLPAEAPASKVHLCADQLANMRITPSRHTASEVIYQLDEHCGSEREDYGSRPANRAEEWERFRELENRLTADNEEEVDISHGKVLSKEGIQLCVANSVVNLTSNNSPILPRTVMEDIQKPCMQIVLWQSPEKLIQHIANGGSNSVDSQTPSSTSSSPITSNLSSISSSNNHASVMSTTPSRITPAASPSGVTCMETMSPDPSVDFHQRSSITGSSLLFLSSAVNRETNQACRLAPSPDFLRPLSSSSGSPLLASSSFFAPAISNPVDLCTTRRSQYLNNNNNNNRHSNNNFRWNDDVPVNNFAHFTLDNFPHFGHSRLFSPLWTL
ncbi:hypothetical protein ElyMa_006100700 [Elysia marginata]|uniref:Uncharacterized protein n=1 Tax=Elysia marginata TaxID=1093978 RepID=A0AAV4GT08_9GAST|nr:hypothetical protein ElyMa_006100700 [Elysia marginata]